MQEALSNAIRFRRAQIHARWVDLLRADRASTPLGHPDALVHLLDWTLDEIFRALANQSTRRRLSRRPHANEKPECPCGRNPLLAYFSAGEQALQEALILAQSSIPHLDPVERDASLEELNVILRHIAHREIEAFCGVCVHRHLASPAPCCPPEPAALQRSPHPLPAATL